MTKPNRSVWLTGFWGFLPEEEGILGFTSPHDRQRLISETTAPQLVCIYGTKSPETEAKLQHQLLGIIEVDHDELDSWDKMSETSIKRNIDHGRQDKWRHAIPIRRAWRSERLMDVKHLFPDAGQHLNQYTAKYGTWLSDADIKNISLVPLTEVNVFGEPPRENPKTPATQTTLSEILRPSRGVLGGFGDYTYQITDAETYLYLATVKENASVIAGENIPPKSDLFKIGISRSLTNRNKALNISFPKSSKTKWEFELQSKFPNREMAANAEQKFKDTAAFTCAGKSLGNEYFILDRTKAITLFGSLAFASQLNLKV